MKVLRNWIAHAPIARGYITSQVIIPDQNLAKDKLIVEIMPGRVGTIRDEAGRIGWTRGAFPVEQGGLLNLRDLDQALENVRCLPGRAATAFDVVPGATLGERDVFVRHPDDARRFHFVLTADNSGLDAIGRNQLGAIVAVDSPLDLYDQLIATFNSDGNLGVRRRTAAQLVSHDLAQYFSTRSPSPAMHPVPFQFDAHAVWQLRHQARR